MAADDEPQDQLDPLPVAPDQSTNLKADPSMSPVAATVFELLAPAVATADAELLDVEWHGGTLQLVIEQREGVDIDRLASINRLVSPILDQHDPISGRYTLEVSSPGVERPLRRPAHYHRAVGETVIVKTEPHVLPRRVKGPLLEVTETELVVDVTEVDGVDLRDSERRSVAIEDIASAKTVFDWGPTPKKGGKANQGKQSQNKNKNKPNKNKNPQKSKARETGPGGGGKKNQKRDGGQAGRPAEADNQIEQDRRVDDE